MGTHQAVSIHNIEQHMYDSLLVSDQRHVFNSLRCKVNQRHMLTEPAPLHCLSAHFTSHLISPCIHCSMFQNNRQTAVFHPAPSFSFSLCDSLAGLLGITTTLTSISLPQTLKHGGPERQTVGNFVTVQDVENVCRLIRLSFKKRVTAYHKVSCIH